MLVAGNWFYWTATEAGINYGFAKMPTFFDSPKTWGNSHNLVIPRQPAGTPDEVYVAAAKAILWINEHSDEWGIYGGHIPAYDAARESEALLQSDTWNKSLRLFAEMAEEGMLHYPITHPSAAELEGVFNVYVEQAYNGSLTCQDALSRATAEANSILKR
jgi:multiple sugar transport system substrate-binding protein